MREVHTSRGALQWGGRDSKCPPVYSAGRAFPQDYASWVFPPVHIPSPSLILSLSIRILSQQEGRRTHQRETEQKVFNKVEDASTLAGDHSPWVRKVLCSHCASLY